MLCQSYFDLDKLKKSFDKCRDNMVHLEKAVKYLESILTEENFPNWEWDIRVRGTYQNRPYIEFDGKTKSYDCATVSMRYNCCNKRKGSFVLGNISPELPYYKLEWGDRKILDEATELFEGLKLDNIEKFLPKLCDILKGLKILETLNSGCIQLKSLIKELKLAKDF